MRTSFILSAMVANEYAVATGPAGAGRPGERP